MATDTQDDVLSPLPYEGVADVPTSRFTDEEAATRTIDTPASDPVGEPSRELTPDAPPSSDSEGGLLGSPLHRMTMPPAEAATDRGAMLDDGRAPLPPLNGNAPNPRIEDVGTRDLPDITIPVPPQTDVAVVVPVIPDAATAAKITEVVTKRDLARLKSDVTDLYQKVSTLLANNPAKAALALGWLNEARTIGLGQPEQFPTAELRVNQTRTLLTQFEQSQAAVKQYANRLVIWNVVWLLVFGALFVLDQLTPPYFLRGGVSIADLFAPWLTVLAGGMGGAIGALGALGRAVSRREYNADDNLEYYLNALKGAFLGGIAFYLVLGGFVTVAATANLDIQANANAIQQSSSTSPLFIVLAFIAGLAQQRVLGLLGRIWNERIGGSDTTTTTTTQDTPTDLATIPVQDTPVPVATEDPLPSLDSFPDSTDGSDPNSQGGMG